MTRERDIHRAIADWLRWALPAHSVVLTIPGGDGSRVQAPAYRAGTPDIVCALPYGRSIWIEVKTHSKRSKVSSEQAAIHAELTEAGHMVGVVRSIDEAHDLLLAFGIAPRIAAR